MTEKYKVFVGDDTEYNLVIPSNRNIREVCQVIAFSKFKDQEERIYYAMEGEVTPVQRDKDGNLVVELEDMYDYDDFWEYLSTALFIEDLGLFDSDGSIIAERKLQLNREEVRRALDDFLGKFGLIPYEVKTLFRQLTTSHSLATLTSMVVSQVVEGLRGVGENTMSN